jgi:hypothetical protein
VLCPDGSIYICKDINILEVIWAYGDVHTSKHVGAVECTRINKLSQ